MVNIIVSKTIDRGSIPLLLVLINVAEIILKIMIEKQIELEKQMTYLSIEKYRHDLNKAIASESFGDTKVATRIISAVLDDYAKAIQEYLDNYSAGHAVRSTSAAKLISKLPVDITAYITAKAIINSFTKSEKTAQALQGQIGNVIESEIKMREFKDLNTKYYSKIQKDLQSRGANGTRRKNITVGVFNKRLDFHVPQWTKTECFQVGMVLLELFIQSTGLVNVKKHCGKGKTIKYIEPTEELLKGIEDLNCKLEVLQPFYLPMICPPKDWRGIFDGGYISPYLRKNKLIKNNDREYLKKISTAEMPMVYTAINHLQSTAWQINNDVLKVVKDLWEIGNAIAELPDREDELLPPFPYPEKGKDDSFTEEEQKIVKQWKQETYEIHKRNAARKSIRISTSQILRIAEQFKDYEAIWYPYQMDFRGRMYPIPALLQPQGSDLAKGLLRFSEGKKIYGNDRAIQWFKIHGANLWGYDKCSYKERASWAEQNLETIKGYVDNPTENRGWAEADKPFQFLAWCMEYVLYNASPTSFVTRLPIQLDGTCNGLQHYSALLRDEVGGAAVNLIDGDKPSDIYAKVAEKLEQKLKRIIEKNDNENDTNNARHWLELGLNRKLAKRPVMVLPYGGSRMSCREYVTEYLTDKYSSQYLWNLFNVGDNPTDCVYKISVWLSKYLWESITETLKAAIVGMAYLKKLAGITNRANKPLDWLTPVGLLVRENYKSRKQKEIKTELYGTIISSKFNNDIDVLDKQRQINGICPNFIHSLDAACLMLYLNKCKEQGVSCFMTVHDCYGTYATDTDTSARLLREAFVEIYRLPILDYFTQDILSEFTEAEQQKIQLPEKPEVGNLDIEEVLNSSYFFN